MNKSLNNFMPTQGQKLWSEIKQKSTIYREYLPCKELRAHIACYWISKTNNISNEPIYSRIIPDGCMDIVFNIEEINKGKCGYVCGLMTVPKKEKLEKANEFIGIRFWPGGIIPFLKSSANDFTNQLISLDNVLGQSAFDISKNLYIASGWDERLKIIEEKLICLLLKRNVFREPIKSALYTIYKNKGAISIRSLSKEVNISQKQLSRNFKIWIGTNPKTFIKILRFQNVVKHINENTKINFQDLILENGYYDQAHFIKEFKTLYGKTPGKL